MVSSTQRFRDNLSRVFAAARRSADGGVSPFPRARNEFLANKHRRHHRRRLRHLKYPPESSAMAAVRLFRPVQISLALPSALFARDVCDESHCVSFRVFSLSFFRYLQLLGASGVRRRRIPRHLAISRLATRKTPGLCFLGPFHPFVFLRTDVAIVVDVSTSLSSFRAAIILGTLATTVSLVAPEANPDE